MEEFLEGQKVIVKAKFKGAAVIWWDQLLESGAAVQERRISTRENRKEKLRDRFLNLDYR